MNSCKSLIKAEAGNSSLQNRVADMAKEASFPFIGPNCLGIYAPDYVDTFFLPGERIIRPDKGNIGFVSQSGGVLVDQMVKFAGQGIGLSLYLPPLQHEIKKKTKYARERVCVFLKFCCFYFF